MHSELLSDLLTLSKEDKWKDILELPVEKDDAASKILWVWPTESNLAFLKDTLDQHNVGGITSIGCGCGLLEWIIYKYTDLPVIGVEINRQWWESKYSVPPFIPLQYADESPIECHPNYALLFCYFNNGRAFKEYISNYTGKMIIIIGPGYGSGRHTDPQPFSVDFSPTEFTLIQHQEVRNTKDFIAVYYKDKKSLNK